MVERAGKTTIMGYSDRSGDKGVIFRLAKSFMTDVDVAADFALARERRSWGWMNSEVIEDKRALVVPDTSTGEKVLVCVPRMARLLKTEGVPVFVVHREMTKEGVRARQRPTLYDCLRSLRTDYFKGCTLDEQALARHLHGQLQLKLKETKGLKSNILFKGVVSLAEFAAFSHLFEMEAGDDDTLVLNLSLMSSAEKLAVFKRLYSTLIFMLSGLGANKVTRYLAIQGIGSEIIFHASSLTFEHRLYFRRFNASLQPEGGGLYSPVSPGPAWGFSLLQHATLSKNGSWVKTTAATPLADDILLIEQEINPHGTGLDDIFGFDGSAL